MNKKKIILLSIGILLIVLIILSIILLGIKDNDKEVLKEEDNTIIEKDNIINTNEEVNNNIEEVIDNKEDIKEEDIPIKENKPVISNNNNNSSNNTPSSDNTPKIVYYCPSGYNLDNDKCISEIDANRVCPNNSTAYSDDTIPRDTYCIDLNDNYTVEENESCNNGYGKVMILGFGTPTTYTCSKLYTYIYTCEDGYTLNNNKCIKIIEANKK